MSNEGNYMARFQYAVLPIVLISWADAIPDFTGRLASHFGLVKLRSTIWLQAALVLAVAVVSCGILASRHAEYVKYNYTRDGRYEVARILRDYRDRGYTIATTEAGLLPFYSEWRAIDTWGLNDSWITHTGGITEEYLDSFKPQVIMLHEYSSIVARRRPPARDWSTMTLKLVDYVEKNGYVLAGAFGVDPCQDLMFYYVRNDFPDSETIINRIRDSNYRSSDTNGLSDNYASDVVALSARCQP
ncbi:MAG: hypothetical protein ABIH46_03085, partial [Chloroflexota bacterium]